MWISQDTDFSVVELDEIFWFIKKKERSENKSNTYIMTMLSRKPRQIIGYAVDNGVKSMRIQEIVDSVPEAKYYCTDGGQAYLNVVFGGKHIRNTSNKNDTHNIESSNADLRHYIAGLARRSRCFFRSMETLDAVLFVFINAYNKYGEAKEKYKQRSVHKPKTNTKHLHEYKDLPFSILDFL